MKPIQQLFIGAQCFSDLTAVYPYISPMFDLQHAV